MTDRWLCATCGVEYDGGDAPPAECPICEDERQYVPRTGQRWTTIDELRDAGHAVEVFEVSPGLHGVFGAGVGIRQQGMLVQTDGGNLLFDIPGVIDDASVEAVRELGGIAAIVASHPHMYGVQSAWSEAFDDAPIYVAEADAGWVQRSVPAIRTWSETFEVLPGIELSTIGGHFPGSTIAHWAAGADGRGVVLAGDAIFPTPDGYVTFLRSYPNRIPLSPTVIRRMADHVAAYGYDWLYNNFGASCGPNARDRVEAAAQRYIAWVSGDYDHLT